jgi:hypothetical protein
LGTVVGTWASIWSVKATDGWDRIESAIALSFSIPRAYVIPFVYLSSILLEATAKTNDFEMV